LRTLILILLLVVVVGCKSEDAGEEFLSPLPTEAVAATTASPLQPTATPVTSPTPPPPEEGRATVVGTVVSRSEGTPLTGVAVRLAEVHRQGDEGAFVLDDAFSPGGTTDELGRFVIEDVEPQEYVIVVGDVGTQYDILAEPSGDARVWEVPSDQVLDVGELEVELHP
jgi:hypothetical protein